MSRAFVRESDVPALPELPPPASPLPPGAKNYMTPGGVQRLQQELIRLLDVERPPLAAARPDDMDAKHQLQLLDQRIRYLQQSLRSAEVVAPRGDSEDTVRFGATVTVRETNGMETRYRIVGVDETDLERNWVSWLSPIARALTNAKVGQRIVVKTPRHVQELAVIAVSSE